MVQFGPTTSILNNSTNATAKISAGSSSGLSKKRFPVTPYPSKECGKDNLPPDPTSACVSDVNSPEMARTQNNADEGGAAGDEEQDDEQEENDEWKQFMESATSDDAPNLPAFLGAKSTRETAKVYFSAALEEYVNGLTQAMTQEMLQDSVVAVHQEQGERFETYEADIVATLKTNHARRNHLLKKMDDANSRWGRQYKRLRQGILSEEKTPALDTNDGFETNGSIADDGKDQRGEPDWNELAQFEPSRENVRRFLAARGKLQDANDSLSHALDEIHEGLKADADAIVQIVVEFYDQHENQCQSLEDDVQYHIAQNCKRRETFQHSLEESAKQAQGLIANLLSRLSQKL